MRTFISTGRNKSLSSIDDASVLAGGYRWSRQAAYIELPDVIGGDHSQCHCIYVLPRINYESYLVCYVPELGKFEQACHSKEDLETLLTQCPTLKQLVQASATKEYNTCFLLKVKDFSHKGLSSKHLCIATILKTPFVEKELFNSANQEFYDKISLIISMANSYLGEVRTIDERIAQRVKEMFTRRKIRRLLRVALVGVLGFDLFDVLDNDIEAMDAGGEIGDLEDSLDDMVFDDYSDGSFVEYDTSATAESMSPITTQSDLEPGP